MNKSVGVETSGADPIAKLHLIKLSVGTTDLTDMADWQGSARAQTADGLPRHVTRMWPRRADELLTGGSIFWVIKGVVLCRQRILRLDEVRGADGLRRCAIVMEPKLHRTAAAPRQPFQGWRYLPSADAPPDLAEARPGDDALPPALSAALAEIGLR